METYIYIYYIIYKYINIYKLLKFLGKLCRYMHHCAKDRLVLCRHLPSDSMNKSQ